jgi:hypothetical protein
MLLQFFAAHPDTTREEEGQYVVREKVTFWTWGQSCAVREKKYIKFGCTNGTKK